MLIILLEHFGYKRWSLIGEKMVVKSELQIRERYCNIIDPCIGKDSYWTAEMEDKLLELAPEYDFCWNKLSKILVFQSKTDNCIWRKYRALLIRKSNE